MADAGRILIIPKGDYDANSTYDKLDLVKYKGSSWLAKKATAGIEPSEANAEWWQNMFDINIANNLTTTAEGLALDARQGKVLDDKIAVVNNKVLVLSLSEQIMIVGDILTQSLGVPRDSMCWIILTETATNLPSDGFEWIYSTGLIMRRGEAVKIILYAYNSSDVAYNCYIPNEKAWSGWTIK